MAGAGSRNVPTAAGTAMSREEASMRTRDRLNGSFFGGSLVFAALLGVWAESGAVFVAAAIFLLACNLLNNEIRLK